MGANVAVILDDENRLAMTGARQLRARGRILLAGGAADQPRQVKLHRGAPARLAVDLDVAARLLDEAVDLREAEPGALADPLGREERLERAVDDALRHTGSGVA